MWLPRWRRTSAQTFFDKFHFRKIISSNFRTHFGISSSTLRAARQFRATLQVIGERSARAVGARAIEMRNSVERCRNVVDFGTVLCRFGTDWDTVWTLFFAARKCLIVCWPDG